ncbi:hypothetical protein HXA32_20715 [Salipaludibacillus agaradhaerens]|nr:hypothetical protein [Salipaludibacillus agaradhaerens]MCR6108698.1 hypothetical protein [Salipaludibacillus agaradhaerens]
MSLQWPVPWVEVNLHEKKESQKMNELENRIELLVNTLKGVLDRGNGIML